MGGLIALLVVGGGVTGYFMWRPGTESAAQTITQTAVASLETIQKSVSTSGSVRPAVNEQVSFAGTGTVAEVFVEPCDVVTEGQTLARLDPLELNAALLQAEAELAAAEVSLEQAQNNSTGSAADIARISAAEASVEVMTAQLDRAQASLAAAELLAPAAGLITASSASPGDYISAGSAATAGFTLVSTDSWTVEVSVGESSGSLVEITAGLTAGTEVLVAQFTPGEGSGNRLQHTLRRS